MECCCNYPFERKGSHEALGSLKLATFFAKLEQLFQRLRVQL